MRETFNPKAAAAAQIAYCTSSECPDFAPRDGRCYRCGRQIYQQFKWPDGHKTGISEQKASGCLITGCPHCHYSFVE